MVYFDIKSKGKSKEISWEVWKWSLLFLLVSECDCSWANQEKVAALVKFTWFSWNKGFLGALIKALPMLT